MNLPMRAGQTAAAGISAAHSKPLGIARYFFGGRKAKEQRWREAEEQRQREAEAQERRRRETHLDKQPQISLSPNVDGSNDQVFQEHLGHSATAPGGDESRLSILAWLRRRRDKHA